MTIQIKHRAVTGRPVGIADWNAQHTITGTPGMYLSFDGAGNLVEVAAPSGSTPTPTPTPGVSTITLGSTPLTIAEGNMAGMSMNTAFAFPIGRSGNTTSSCTVEYVLSGTGSNPANVADFTSASLYTDGGNVFTFPPGVSSGYITVYAVGDTAVEQNEAFRLTICCPSANAVLGTNTFCDATILNDDSPPATPGTINAPTITKFSAAGAAPFIWETTLDNSQFAGDTYRAQTATNSGFTTGVTDYVKPISPSEFDAGAGGVGAGDWTNASVTPSTPPFNTPPSLFYFRLRVERYVNSGTIVSPWSNVLTDTITSTTMKLSNTFKNTAATVSSDGLTVTGDYAGSTLAITGKRYFECSAADANLICGVVSGAYDFATYGGGYIPGQDFPNAATWHSNGYVYASGGGQGSSGFTNAAGAVRMIAIDAPAGGSGTGKMWVGQNGVWEGGIDPATGTGGHAVASLPSWYLHVKNGTANFGASAFAYTKPTGFGAMP